MSDSSSIEAHAGQLASVGSSSRVSPAIYKKLVALSKEPIHVKKAYAYAELVKKLNTSRVRGLPFQPAMCFKDVYESLGVEVTNGKSVTMQKIWQLVQAITSEDSAVRQGVSKRMSLAKGARRHLQRGHEKHIMDTIQSHPTQASLGNLQRIRAFLRIRLREYGSLDFDPPDSPRQAFLDTTCQQIYFCLRTGYYEEAREIARSTHSAQQFAPLLTEWIATDGMVAAETAAIATEECEKMLRTAYDEKKLLVYTIISGSRRQIERILRDLSTLFNTIEDLLWFKLSCVRDVTGGSPSVVLNDGLAPYSFDDLQAYLNKMKNENDPLVYPYVLLLSIQFLPAVLHLSKEAVDRGYLIDAVHIAISLVDHSVISEGSGTGIMDANAEASSIIKQYVSMFLIHGDLQMTAEYYAQAAVTVGGGQLAWSGRSSVDQQRQRNLMLTQLLTEILRREGGIYSLLGARGSGEEDQLGRFFPDSRLRHQFLIEAAHHFQDAGSYDKSIEIHKRVGAFSAALETINKCLSEAICFLAHGWLDGESQTAGLLLLGNDILQTYNCYPEVSLQEKKRVMEQENILRELEAIMLIHKLASQGDHLEALRGIAKLPSLHLDPRLPDATVDVFQSAPPYLQTCVPDLLRVALTCLDNVNVPDTDGSNHAMRSKIAGLLASNTHRNWPRDLYEKATERPNSSEFSSSEPKQQEKQKKALLLKTETLKSKLEGLQILSESLHGESCKHLSRSELTLLRCLLLQGRLNVEDQLAQKKRKMEDDKVLEQENKDSFSRQLELSKKRSILRWKRKDRRLFHEEVQRELEPVQMKKKIKYMKREIKRLQLLNERMIGNELHGMGYYELMALKKEILSTLLLVQSRRSSKKGEEEVLSVANGVKALELETSESDELDFMQPGDFMIPYCSKLGMSQQAVKAAKEAVLKCEDIDIRRSHIIIVAVVLYLITQLSDDKKPLKDISKATGVADVTIRNAYKELSPHFPKIAPSWYAKEEDLKNISSP